MKAHSIDLQQGEHIVTEIRRDMFVFYMRVIILFILAILPLAAVIPVGQFISQNTNLSGGIVVTILYLFFILLLTVIFFYRWTDYYLDVWILTNRRIFDVEQKGLFNRQISVFEIDKIQDVNVEIKGIVATFIKYGDILIHTAGMNQDIVIKEADNPLEVKKKILEQYSTLMQKNLPDTASEQT